MANKKKALQYLEEKKKMQKRYDYKDGIALRNIGPGTSWESIYNYLYQDGGKQDVELYIIQQINLYYELKTFSVTQCKAADNVISAVSQFAKDKKMSFDKACDFLQAKYIKTVKMVFLETLEKLISDLGVDEKPFADMIGYDRSVIHKIRSGERTAPKNLLYAICLFMEYDLEKCEDLFNHSPHPLHKCFPDNVFRAYVKSDNRSLQPFVEITCKMIAASNRSAYKVAGEQNSFKEFFDPLLTHSLLVLSDFKENDGYVFDSRKIKSKKDEMAGVRRIYDDRLDVEG